MPELPVFELSEVIEKAEIVRDTAPNKCVVYLTGDRKGPYVYGIDRVNDLKIPKTDFDIKEEAFMAWMDRLE